MPLYLYKCQTCGKEFEFLKQGKDEMPRCPKCGSAVLEKLPTTYRIKMWQTSRK